MGKEISSPFSPLPGDKKFAVELNHVPIVWDLDNGSFSFFGHDAALFWTDPSLVRILAPLAEEIGTDLFRLLIAHSSSMGTDKDFHAMVSTLGSNFADGFLAWGKAVSGAGWGTFEMTEYEPENSQATILVRSPWELSMQRNLPSEKHWGCPFLQGKIIGIFGHAFGLPCWADETCHYNEDNSYVTFKVYPSPKTISEEIINLRQEKMLIREQTLSREIELKTAELEKNKITLENYSKTLELKVAERTKKLETLLALLEREKEKLKVMAETDPMTSLYNRRAFFDLGNSLMDGNLDVTQPIAVVVLDIDHFKQINDTYGHFAGDQVLIEFSRLMGKMFRSSDVIGRLGGEEFGIICFNADFLANKAPLENFRKTVEESIVIYEGQEIHFTISIGAAVGSMETGLDKLFKQADRLLYKAKDAGRNTIIIEKSTPRP